jgi:lantibiotic modifying enzyme
VEWSDGREVMYKPRPLAVDVGFNALISRFNEESRLPLRVARVADRGDHGWVEYIRTASCGTRRELADFYWRIGAILSLVHGLNGTDFHFQNRIAAGEQPVLVDLEALLYPCVHGAEA